MDVAAAVTSTKGNMKPIIGINVDIHVIGQKQQAVTQSNYFDAVIKAGGIPVLIPPMPEEDLDYLLSKIDGLMLIGGDDYSPSLYGDAKQHPTVVLTAKNRESHDMLLVRKAVALSTIPILGICAGCQALNIAMGGSLVQDIPDEFPDSHVKHSAVKGCWEIGFNKHTVKLTQPSKLATIYGSSTVDVPTSHHQAVKKPASAFRPVAFADDGVIEAIESPEHPYLIGVQWHPERDFDGNKRLFDSFISAALRANAVPVK